MKKFRLVTALSLVLLLALGSPLSALAATWDVTDSQGVADAFATDTDAEVVINMQNDINMDHYLQAREEQTYVINGNGNTISDVMLGGEGSVDINADVSAEDNSTALSVYGDVDVTVEGDITSDGSGVYANSGADVTVEGDITAEDTGVMASDDATVTVEGNVTAEEGNAINAWGEDTSVDVTGDVSGGYGGISAGEGADVSVEGDVTASDNSAINAQGEGTTVDVTGDVSGEYGGASAGDGAAITIEGNVDGNQGAAVSTWEMYTEEDTPVADPSVTVNGNVTSEGGVGVGAWDGTVEVNGDVTGAAGVYAGNDATVTVNGDVGAESAEGWSSGQGVYAQGEATVTVNGDVSGSDAVATEEELQDPTYGEWGGDGVAAIEDASVTVNGNVTGGDGAGTTGDGGTGVYAEDNANVTVEGDVTGGDVVADPEVEAEGQEVVIDAEGNTETYYWYISTGGEGVSVSNTANVTINGDVTGGDTNGDHGEGGHAIWVHNYDEVTADESTGALNITGTATGGAGGANGEGGAALYFNAFAGFLPSEDLDLEAVVKIPAEDLTEDDFNVISYLLNYALNEGLMDLDALDAVEETVAQKITEDMTDDEIIALYYGEYQKLVAESITDFDAVQINGFADITVGTLSDKNGPKLNSSAGQEAAEEYAKEIVDELAPTGDNPRTGDDFNGMFFVALMTLSLLGVGALLTQRKRFV